MTRTMARPQGVWAWIWQRITAVLLVLLLGTHLAILHYVPANMNIDVAGVAARLKSVLYLVVDTGLLAFGLYHALNGVRNVVFDFVVAEGTRRVITTILWVAGVAFALWGAYALWLFLQ